MHLLLSANRETGRWKGIEVLRGQLITGLKTLHQQAGISIQSLRTSLDKLKSTGEVTIQSTNRFSIITIINYDSYQSYDNRVNKPINNPANKQLTNNQQAANKQLTTNNNIIIKELKNDKKYIIYAECVKLTEEEHQKLLDQFQESGTLERIQALNDYIQSTGKRYKSHYHTILNWERKNNGQIRRSKQPLACEKGTTEGKYAELPFEIINTDNIPNTGENSDEP